MIMRLSNQTVVWSFRTTIISNLAVNFSDDSYILYKYTSNFVARMIQVVSFLFKIRLFERL